jgi:hypothetical protein
MISKKITRALTGSLFFLRRGLSSLSETVTVIRRLFVLPSTVSYSFAYKVTLTLFCLILSDRMSQTRMAEWSLGIAHSALAEVTRCRMQTPLVSYDPSWRTRTIANPVLETADISSLTGSPCLNPSMGMTAGLCPGSTTTSVCVLTVQFVDSKRTKAKSAFMGFPLFDFQGGAEFYHV